MDTKASGAGVTHQRPENLLQRRELHQLLNHPFSHGWVIFRRKSLSVALRTKNINHSCKSGSTTARPSRQDTALQDFGVTHW